LHELPFAKSIFKAVIAKAEENDAKAVTMVALEVGVLRDFVPQIVQKYWEYVTKGSIAEGSVIEMKEIAATAECRDCKNIYQIDVKNITATRCPQCGCDMGKLLTGRELKILGIEIE